MNNFEALHPRAGGTGKNRTQFASKQHSDAGIPTLGGGTDLRVVMRGEEATVVSVAREDSISLLGDTPRNRPLNPTTPEMRAQQEAFNQQLQEAQGEFDRSRAKAAWALGDPSPAETGAGSGTRVVMRGEEAVVRSVATEPSISLSDELSKSRRGFSTRSPEFGWKEARGTMDQEAFERKYQEAAQQFNAGPGAPVATGERPWSPPPIHQEPSISLSDELSKPRRSRFPGFMGRNP